MTDTNGIVILTPDDMHPNAGQNYDWFDSLEGAFGKTDSVNGTTSADSMPQQVIKLRLPDGFSGGVHVFYEIDDWGKVVLKNVTNNNEVTLIDMEYSQDKAGVRNGHAVWSGNKYRALRKECDYEIIITHTNANYPPEYDSKYNVSYARFVITLEKWADNENLESCSIHFDKQQTEKKVDVENEKNIGATHCASGYVYTGRITAAYSNGDTASFDVQSGGWMYAKSPWTTSKIWAAPDASLADKNPENFPDTCIPAGIFHMETRERGELLGFYFVDADFAKFTDEMQKRTDMKIHIQERYGSAGCVSTPESAAWDRFRAAVAHLNSDAKIVVPISYASNLEVDYYRGLKKK